MIYKNGKEIKEIYVGNTKIKEVYKGDLLVWYLRLPKGSTYNFKYTGSPQLITLPRGRYKLQAWGAQGGSYDDGTVLGANGGYSEGILTLNEETLIYVYVGGQGPRRGTGGWNGGGDSKGESEYGDIGQGQVYGISWPACGGGATDFRNTSSLHSRFLVAGGGAGCSLYYRREDITREDITTHLDKSTTLSYLQGSNQAFAGGSFYCYTNKVYHGTYDTSAIMQDGPTWMDANTWVVLSRLCDFLPPYEGRFWFGVFCKPEYTDYSVTIRVYTSETVTNLDVTRDHTNGNLLGGGTSGRGGYPGTQTSGGSKGGYGEGSFGKGGDLIFSNFRFNSGGGGGGWYGGGCDWSDYDPDAIHNSGGGSGFVNTSSNAAYRPSGYTGLQLDSGTTIDGANSFISPNNSYEYGHSGNGYARITVL